MSPREHVAYTWDPGAAQWVHERGPTEGAPAPPAPEDAGVVATYFWDPATGLWVRTILAAKGREIEARLKSGQAYGSAIAVIGLPPGPRTEVRPQRRPRPVLAGIALALVGLAAGGGFAVRSMSQPTAESPAPVAVATLTPAPESSPTAAPTASPTEAPPPTVAPPPAAAPPPPPPPPASTPRPPAGQQSASTLLPGGIRVFYSGPASVAKGSAFTINFTVQRTDGRPIGGRYLAGFVGEASNPGGHVTSNGRTDANGNISLTLRATLPAGSHAVSFLLEGQSGILRIATMQIR